MYTVPIPGQHIPLALLSLLNTVPGHVNQTDHSLLQMSSIQ